MKQWMSYEEDLASLKLSTIELDSMMGDLGESQNQNFYKDLTSRMNKTMDGFRKKIQDH